MIRRASLCVVALAFALIAAGNLWAQYDLVKVINDRRGVMFEIQSAYWPLLDIKNGKSTDLAVATASLQSTKDALGRFSALMLPGTAKGEVPGSRATSEVWTEPKDFAAALNALDEAASSLSDAASSGDMELFKARFEAFAAACVGCHGLKPSSGGRFRSQF